MQAVVLTVAVFMVGLLLLNREIDMRVDMTTTHNDEPVFVSLDSVGLEENNEHDPVHGYFHSCEGSIYSYTEWFYDGDESAFSTC